MRLVILLLVFIAHFGHARQANQLYFVTESLPPYQIVVDNQLFGGTSYELVVNALKAANMDAAIDVYPWARAFHLAKTKANTVIFSMARTEEREKDFIWLYKLKPLVYKFYFSANRDYREQFNVTQVNDYVAATVRGSYEFSSLNSFGFKQNKNLIITKDYDSMWALLDQGTVDMVYASHIPLTAQVDSRYGFVAYEPVIKQYDLYIAANKNSDAKLINQFVTALNDVASAKISAQ